MKSKSGAPDKALLELLLCPQTKRPLRYDDEKKLLVCDNMGLAYPVRDGVPILLSEEAIKL